jgi:hypothetical protein
MQQKVVKSAKKIRKMCKKKVEKCEKVRKIAKCECDAKMESKFASHYCEENFSHFFASHSHRTTIPAGDPSKPNFKSLKMNRTRIVQYSNSQQVDVLERTRALRCERGELGYLFS